jgi:hypothetical protein
LTAAEILLANATTGLAILLHVTISATLLELCAMKREAPLELNAIMESAPHMMTAIGGNLQDMIAIQEQVLFNFESSMKMVSISL